MDKMVERLLRQSEQLLKRSVEAQNYASAVSKRHADLMMANTRAVRRAKRAFNMLKGLPKDTHKPPIR